VLYVNNKPGRMLRIDGGEPEEVDNGQDGVIFLWDDKWQPWDYDRAESSQDLWRELVYSRFSLDNNRQEDAPTLDELCALLDAYVQTIFFREKVPHRPILAHIGPFGSGKTRPGRHPSSIPLQPCASVISHEMLLGEGLICMAPAC
jgi:hypothetical protein